MITLQQIEWNASDLAQTPVTIQCVSPSYTPPGGWSEAPIKGTTTWGWVIFNPDGSVQPVIYMRQRLCTDLEHLNNKTNPNMQPNNWDSVNPKDEGFGPHADAEDGMALSVLNHEATHIRTLSQDESFVECQNYRTRAAAVLIWGLPKWKALRLYWGMKIAHNEAPKEYREAC